VFSSFVYGLLTTAVAKFAGPDNKYQAYLGLGAEAGGRQGSALPSYMRGYGEYVATNGYGEYVASGIQGFGNPLLEQAHAGYGALLEQAAASGYGAYQQPPISQAVAGYGYGAAPSGAIIQEAAAGYPMGEYVASGIKGIGEYEMSPMTGMGASKWQERDGIRPDLHSAERALSVAESMAGIGDLNTLSIVEPTQVAAPVGDMTDGTRSGILAGRDGIFG
jgi:hypothetical protein